MLRTICETKKPFRNVIECTTCQTADLLKRQIHWSSTHVHTCPLTCGGTVTSWFDPVIPQKHQYTNQFFNYHFLIANVIVSCFSISCNHK